MSSIQFDYSTLSTSISRSELGSIIGRHIVENEYDINEETSSEGSSNPSEIFVESSPPDKFKLVYLTFGLLGIGTLLPWNFFITANDYWMFKFHSEQNMSCINSHNKTDLQAAFTSYLALSNNVPYVIFLMLCTLFNNRFSKELRVTGSLIIMLLLFAAVTSFVEVDTDSWQMEFFSLTILIIVIVGMASAVLQAGVAGIASLLPAKYMHIMVLGQAFAGILAAVFQILSLLGHCDSIKSALIYFFSADAVIIVTLLSYAGIQKSSFYKYHMRTVKAATILKDVSQNDLTVTISVFHTFKLVWPYAISILLDFWVTLGIYPGLAVLNVPHSHGTPWSGKLFLPIACFLMLNLSDFIGRAVGGWLPLPHSKRMFLLTLSALRISLFPLFMLCNLQPRNHLPIMFTSDYYYISFMAVLGFTNGYIVASSMLVGIKSVSPTLQEIVGVILSAVLGAGLMLGSLTSYICLKII